MRLGGGRVDSVPKFETISKTSSIDHHCEFYANRDRGNETLTLTIVKPVRQDRQLYDRQHNFGEILPFSGPNCRTVYEVFRRNS